MINENPYYTFHRREGRIAGRMVPYFSKLGMPGGETLTPAEVLLAEQYEPRAGSRILLLGSGHGVLISVLAGLKQIGQIDVADPHLISLRMAVQTVRSLPPAEIRFRLDCGLTGLDPLPLPGFADNMVAPQPAPGTYDDVLILLPKGRSLLRRWLLEAQLALRPGGRLYLAGANDEGIQPAVKDAGEVFGAGGVLGYKKGCRVVRFSRGAEPPLPAWAHEPGTAPGTWHEFSLNVAGSPCTIHSLPGVFSTGHLDEGSALLLEHLHVIPEARLLDLGCGYGVLGISALRSGAASVDLTDASLLAVASSRATLSANELSGGRIFARDVLEGSLPDSYDHIIANPPFHAGHDVQYAMADALISGAREALSAGGRLTLVANRFIRYDRLLKEVFGGVTILAETGKFHVLEAQK